LFPKRFQLHPGGRAVGHVEAEIDQWIEDRAATREAA
jgi:predicted DNA-binding transcriptional regulator AlpA